MCRARVPPSEGREPLNNPRSEREKREMYTWISGSISRVDALPKPGKQGKKGWRAGSGEEKAASERARVRGSQGVGRKKRGSAQGQKLALCPPTHAGYILHVLKRAPPVKCR